MFVQYKGHTIVHTQQFTPFQCDFISIFQGTGVLRNCWGRWCKMVRNFLPSSITSTHEPNVELFIKCFMTNKTTELEDRHRRTGMLMTTILLVLLGLQCSLRTCAPAQPVFCWASLIRVSSWSTVKPHSIQIREVSNLPIYCELGLFS